MDLLKSMNRLVAIIFLSFIGTIAFSQSEYFDLAYLPSEEITEDTLQRLNLFLPVKDNAPLILGIGGGAWSYVNRNMETDLGCNFATAGIAVAAVGHRLSAAVWRNPEWNKGVQHPKHIEDIADALKWLVDHSSQYGYDGLKVFIGGFSSGAHLAALLAMDDEYLEAVGVSLDNIAGIIAISGAYDIAGYHEVFASGSRPELAVEHVESVFGSTQEGWIATSPTTYIDKLKSPMLLMTNNRVDNYTR
jgi:acetyl esterase/lipase